MVVEAGIPGAGVEVGVGTIPGTQEGGADVEDTVAGVSSLEGAAVAGAGTEDTEGAAQFAITEVNNWTHTGQ